MPEVAGATILVVDDDPAIVGLLRVSFELDDYEVLEAGDGDGALEAARVARPDLVVLDVMLPGRDGLQVARVLRADPVTAGIPLLLLSAKAQPGDVEAGAAVADEYVTKPFDPIDLLARAAKLIERRRSGAG
jgi:two-component system alkaline phosphatase synthesis response regulator PhoP